MSNIMNILVTTDLSELSAAALEHTVAIASLTGATVHVLYVIESVPRYSVPAANEESEKLLQDRGAMARVVRYSPIPVLTVKPKAFVEKLITQEDVELDLHIHTT